MIIMRILQILLLLLLPITSIAESCSGYSPVIKQFKEILTSDSYTIGEKGLRGDLVFSTVSGESVTFSHQEYKQFYAKRNYKIKRHRENFYPSFSVAEICFNDSATAAAQKKKIEKIINSYDRYNDKKYDYILLNGNKLIYVWTTAKIFEEFALSYKEKLKEHLASN